MTFTKIFVSTRSNCIIIKSILMGIQRMIFTNDNIVLTIRDANNTYCCKKHNCNILNGCIKYTFSKKVSLNIQRRKNK